MKDANRKKQKKNIRQTLTASFAAACLLGAGASTSALANSHQQTPPNATYTEIAPTYHATMPIDSQYSVLRDSVLKQVSEETAQSSDDRPFLDQRTFRVSYNLTVNGHTYQSSIDVTSILDAHGLFQNMIRRLQDPVQLEASYYDLETGNHIATTYCDTTPRRRCFMVINTPIPPSNSSDSVDNQQESQQNQTRDEQERRPNLGEVVPLPSPTPR